MTAYAQMPGSGLILPNELARSVVAESLFYGNRGAYRTASSRNKNTAGWIPSFGSADGDSIADLPTLRRQSSDLCRNDPLAAGAVNGVVTSVVGTGLVPQSRIDYEYLGINQEDAAKFERMAERLFEHAANTRNFDIERRQTFYQQQDLVYRSKKERGDCFVVRRYKKRLGRMIGTCAQVIEADRVATPLGKVESDRLRAGIEMDADGAPTRCWIMQGHPGDRMLGITSTEFTSLPFYDDVGNAVVLPQIDIKRPSQSRGVPYLAPVIEMLKQLSRYSEAEITAAVISSLFAVFVTTDAPTSPLGNAPMGVPGAVGMPTGGANALAGNGKLQKMQSGMIMDLLPGEKIEVADAKRPNTAFDPFVLSVLRQIGVALELPFEILVKHFTASYSAARAALLEAWKFYRRERASLIDGYCQPVWEWVLTEYVALGILKAPGFFDDPLRRSAWLRCEWVGPEMEQIDPDKEADAAKKWNDLGVKSLQRIAGESGIDFDREHKQIVKERRMREADGLVLEVGAELNMAKERQQSGNKDKAAQAGSDLETPDLS